MSGSAAQVPDFHIVSAELALALHHLAEAQAQFETVCRLDPTNRLDQLNLAVIRLSSTDAPAAAVARAKLKQFSQDADLGPSALRSLTADRLRHNDMAGALDYSQQLLASPQASLNRRHPFGSPLWTVILPGKIGGRSATSPRKVPGQNWNSCGWPFYPGPGASWENP